MLKPFDGFWWNQHFTWMRIDFMRVCVCEKIFKSISKSLFNTNYQCEMTFAENRKKLSRWNAWKFFVVEWAFLCDKCHYRSIFIVHEYAKDFYKCICEDNQQIAPLSPMKWHKWNKNLEQWNQFPKCAFIVSLFPFSKNFLLYIYCCSMCFFTSFFLLRCATYSQASKHYKGTGC